MTDPCSAALLERALAGDLPPEREGPLHRHLEECEACSAALEQMAGGAAWCQEAATHLAGDELDDAVPGYPRAGGDEWSGVDFTVEHLEPCDEPNVLGRLGGYDVLEIIGRGGMGVVLKAFDRELKRYVAIKVLAPHLAQSSLARKRFAREAQAAAAVIHPNVLAIHQVQAGGRLPFLVMPLLTGESLAARLAAQGRLGLKETLRVGMQAAAALAAAHEQGLVHRDVKPANILLEKGVERAVLTDFGLARAADDVSMTRWGVIAGTPQYMSPEQARGEPLDGRSDLFSLGCVLYEMATGVSPFRADSTMATLRRLIEDPPPAMASLNPELPPWFVAIVDRLLEKEPSRRFGSAKEVAELLEGCLAHVQQPASVPLPTGLPLPAARRVSALRKNLWKGAIAMSAIMGIALLGIFFVQSTEPPDIAGKWSGEGWGQVVLTQTAAGEYAGTYSDGPGKEPGKIALQWSRMERRFNGTWREGEDRFGDISIRLIDREIRGARTIDPQSKVDPATPRLAELVWTPVEGMAFREAAAPTQPAPAQAAPAPKPTASVAAEKTLETMASLLTAVRLYELDCGTYPPSLEALARNPGDKSWKGPYIEASPWPPVDAWGTPFRYRPAGTAAGSAPILQSAGSDGRFDTADDVQSGGGAPKEESTAAAAPRSARLFANQEQVAGIEALLKRTPVTANYLAEIFEHNPASPSEYRVRADVEVIPVLPAEQSGLGFIPLGQVFYMPRSGGFYLQWDDVGASTLHYYGPLWGDPAERLGLKRPADQLRPSESKAHLEGQEQARKDVESGQWKYMLYGQPQASDPLFSHILKKDYDVTLVIVGGCTVAKEARERANGYNEVMLKHLQEQWKKDVIKEAEAKARSQWEEEHAKGNRR